jgi:hypothetical protein
LPPRREVGERGRHAACYAAGMADPQNLQRAMEIAALARGAGLKGRFYEAASLYKEALIVLHHLEATAGGDEAEVSAVTETPRRAETTLQENLAVDPTEAANAMTEPQKAG